ncbi:hypothetical protein GCM10011360_27890 [Primorskyibacter flagellatus]|uniref:Arylsulfatase n=1 Tax=Primorskyibacter flagellatus TaxID=1387277 RepID=A0A917EIF6_9RHOB|nr:hypothetical protein [Primorskyibacter flagellatus]GGE38524.1 hypothetical protein GCM10011360_27890 [Primorskyibacter flagellatus]
MALTLLHTAAVHVATFDALRDRIAPGSELRHVVRPDWLDRARADGAEAVRDDLRAVLADGGRVLCTCTTLGPLAAELGALRVDAPMMRAAARSAGPVVMAYALESTVAPSRDLFVAEGGDVARLKMLDLTRFWPLFVAGETGAFHAAVAGAVRDHAPPAGSVVVLAQVSMAGAADHLRDLAVPVLSSPETALKVALGAAF